MAVGNRKEADCFERMYPSRFLKAGLLLDKKVTLCISDVFIESMPDEKTGTEKDRGIVCFKETPMQLALNRTNGECFRAMFGKKPKLWIGKRVTLVPEQAKFGAETVDAIRIFGSPDIDHQIDIEIKMPKRKASKRTLVNTSKQASGSAPQPPKQEKTAIVADTGGVIQSQTSDAPMSVEEMEQIQATEKQEEVK